MRRLTRTITLLLLSLSPVVLNANGLSQNLDAPAAGIHAGSPATLFLVLRNPTADPIFHTPAPALDATLASSSKKWKVQLTHAESKEVKIDPARFVTLPYTLQIPSDAGGQLILQTADPSLALVLNITRQAAAADNPPPAPLGGFARESAASWLDTNFARNFGTHDPIYFLYGHKDPAAKFQISFKYRLLGNPDDTDSRSTTRGLYMAYTQRSLWDTRSESSPFHDTSYMPEIFFQSSAPAPVSSQKFGFTWLGWQAGFRHESNGKDGDNSRSLNIVYIRPAMLLGKINSWRLIFAPRLYAYIGDMSDNPDMRQYRGYAEWLLSFGKNRCTELNAVARIGTHFEHGSIELNLTHPIRIVRADFETYLHLQYFKGYGESLRDYNQRASQLRLGISIAR